MHYDTGAVQVIGNIVGPGGVHGFIDVKGIGSASTPALIQRNVVDGGQSGNLAGSTNTPAFYTEDTWSPSTTITWQENVAYDTNIGIQLCPGGTPTGFTTGGSWKVYNNTFYSQANNSSGTADGYFGEFDCAGANAGTYNKFALDVRNNIFDGGASSTTGTLAIYTTATYSSITEDYNDIGGA